MAVDKYNCRECHKNIAATGQSPSPFRYRKHDREKATECPNSRTIIPAWIVKRGPEAEDTDVPVIGRDYAPCPECKRSPLLDDEGRYALHIKEPGVPSSERVDCPKSGQPYEAPEGEECTTTESPTSGESLTAPTVPASTATDARPAASPARESEGSPAPSLSGPPSPKAAPSDAANTPTASTPAAPAAAAPTEAEEMLSKWATKAREIENRKLPETEPSPASTPTPQALPPRPDAPEAPPPAKPDSASTEPAAGTRSAADAVAASGAASSSTKSSKSETPPDVKALAKLFPRSARTPDSTAASAGPTPAGALAVHSCGQDPHLTGCKTTYPGAPTPTPDAAPSTAATPPTPADALPSSDVPYWIVPDSSGGPPIDLRRLKAVAHSCGLADGHTVDCVLTLDEKEPQAPVFAQPGSPFSQPAKLPAAVTDPIPMTVLGEQVAARMKELFYSYDNRNTSDNRSAQTTLGPSEIGTPCDRRLAMSLLQIPPVNPGGDGWAAFVGTCIHAGLAEMFVWASGDTGRFAVEQRLQFPNQHVPGGTADLLDRTLCMVDDHKSQGRWSLDKLRTQGMTPTQRVQLHTYGYGMRLKGEAVDFVAIISWPREASSLADLYVVVEPYDPQIARDALERVDGIAAEIKMHETVRATWAGLDINAHKLGIAKEFDIDPESCKFCPFFAPGDADMTRGCNGRA
ncbi:hypothetical protein [Streptomyces sp. OK228]|uniref:hypothetical protein n=1 Tax=Streptomyces sp. OK228 TaxID=1882786 RepID=UPI000BCF7E7B|nr:hypothetical protein [Streptomyces sp. OK228]SOE25686.1 hypothetical protein SAMN05442782_2430 [Streptomyces sp. OK228]